MNRKLCCVVPGIVSAMLVLRIGSVYGQTPGQIAKFDPASNPVDSVITEDANGKIGIGTANPVASLDVAGGDLNLAGNILKGGGLFIHNFGFGNTFVGSSAGNLMMTGGFNTAIGTAALLNNTTGGSNTALGFETLINNTTGSGNTASGGGALFSNISGTGNTASGVQALGSNIDGNDNTASGVRALAANTSGFSNTATGSGGLFSNNIGFSNTANGVSTLVNNTTGNRNTASGVVALWNNIDGNDNTASGFGALFSNTSGANNTAIGMGADVSAGDLQNATAIGAGAIVNASNKVRVGNSAVMTIEGQVAFSFPSDKNQKENFQPVVGEEVLRKIGGLSLTSWNYKGHDPQQFRHYGPVAQEFFAAFGHDGIGTSGTATTINTGDMEGILMIAVQALEKRTAENAGLRARIEALERLVKVSQTIGAR